MLCSGGRSDVVVAMTLDNAVAAAADDHPSSREQLLAAITDTNPNQTTSEQQTIVMSGVRYNISQELQEVLLDFTVQYLIETPSDVCDFALIYFNKLKSKRAAEAGEGGGETATAAAATEDGENQSDASMLSEEERDNGKE